MGSKKSKKAKPSFHEGMAIVWRNHIFKEESLKRYLISVYGVGPFEVQAIVVLEGQTYLQFQTAVGRVTLAADFFKPQVNADIESA